jgi:hypothetical protein
MTMVQESLQTPYELLAEFGVTPDSTQLSLYDLQLDRRLSRRANPAARAALDEIAEVKKRLLVDFFGLPIGPVRAEGEAR